MVVVVDVFVPGPLAQETSVRARMESTEGRMSDFFINVNCFFNYNSSQVASADVQDSSIS